MKSLRLVQLLESVLSKGNHNHKKSEISFKCPFCKHHKKKLNVNLLSQKWHCWVCGTGGHTILGLFRNDLVMVLPMIGKRRDINSTKAKDILKWNPISAEESIVETANQMKEFGLIK